MSPKRLFLLVVLAFVAFAMLPAGAAAGNFDEEKMGCTGENPATCPTGTVGKPYSIEIWLLPREQGTRGEDYGCATFKANGSFPPGLIVTDEGYITGTPTQAGNYQFYLEVHYNKNPGCQKPHSDDQFIIQINPGAPVLPKLTIQEPTVVHGTVGSPYQLPMSANLADPKVWSISAGTLPPGLSINSATGLISGTPTAQGDFGFTVHAVLADGRSDTKTFGVAVRNRLVVGGNGKFSATRTAQTEVALNFNAHLTISGGQPPYEVTQNGVLPDGIAFDVSDNSLSGQAEIPGTYRFTVTVVDDHNRTTTFAGTLVVAPRLAITTKKLVNGKVGTRYRAKLAAKGGVTPAKWRIKRGPLPKGIRFNPTTGSFVGIPVKAGVWVITVELVDALGVKSTAALTLLVKPALARRGR